MRRGPEIHGSQSSMEDWDADLSHCNFVTAHFLQPKKKRIYLPVTSRPPIWQLSFCIFISFNFTTHQMEDPFATPQAAPRGCPWNCSCGLESPQQPPQVLKLHYGALLNPKIAAFPPPNPPPPIPKHPPLLVCECIGASCTMERSAGASFGEARSGVLGEGPGGNLWKPGVS